MSGMLRVAAVDLGATSGRVMVGEVGSGRLELTEVHRFPNGVHDSGGTLNWDVLDLYREALSGLKAALRTGPVDGIGIDGWAVDYGLLDRSGGLIGDAIAYRDSRTDGVMEKVFETIPEAELYAVTGLQKLPFNTLYQLASEVGGPRLEQAGTLLLIPDLVGYWLTGQRGAEVTNASTTQLYDVRRRVWADDLVRRIGVRPEILPPLRKAGELVGGLLPSVGAELGATDLPVIAVGSHDTASAVVGVPIAPGTASAYISSGTWSLVGLELDEPVLTDEARAANFTNEVGVDDTIRFLHNVIGLWVVSESLRTWGDDVALADLLESAARETPLRSVVDIDDPRLLPPGDMPARLGEMLRETGDPLPGSKAGLVRCILDSLALAYRRNVRLAGELSGRPIEIVHVVGGGAQNELLCQLTADACGLPVLAGPVEAAALGNVLVQARTLGADLPDLAAMRRLVAETHPIRRYEPTGDAAAWDEAEAKVFVRSGNGTRRSRV